MTLGARIKQARTLKHFTQKQLAEATGISQQMIGKLESGHAERSAYAYAIAQALDVSPTWLITGTGSIDGQRDLSPDTMECATIIEQLLPEDVLAIKAMLTRLLKGSAATDAKIEERMPVTKAGKRVRQK